MGLEGRLFEEDDLVFFGKPLPEKAFEALKKRSPTAQSIIKSLPESAFIPIVEPKIINEEVIEEKSNEKDNWRPWNPASIGFCMRR